MDLTTAEVLNLPPAPPSPAAARSFTRDRFHAWGLDGLGDVGELVVSELVTNAVRHARTPVKVALARTDAGVRIAVSDRQPAKPPRVKMPADVPEGGRGLFIVAALAARWGCDHDGSEKHVWCELEQTG